MTGRFVYNSAIGAVLKRLFGHDGITLGPVTFVAGPPSGDGSFEVHEARHQMQWWAAVVAGAVLVFLRLFLTGVPQSIAGAAWLLVFPFVFFFLLYYAELAVRVIIGLAMQRPDAVQQAYLDLWAEQDARDFARQARPLPRAAR